MAESSFKVVGRAESQQYTSAQTKAVYDSGIWEGMSGFRRAQFQASQELQVSISLHASGLLAVDISRINMM